MPSAAPILRLRQLSSTASRSPGLPPPGRASSRITLPSPRTPCRRSGAGCRRPTPEQVQRRVAHALLRLAKQAGRKVEEGVRIDFPISRQDIAEMTGTTLHTVSRILSAWEERGWVVVARRSSSAKRTSSSCLPQATNRAAAPGDERLPTRSQDEPVPTVGGVWAVTAAARISARKRARSAWCSGGRPRPYGNTRSDIRCTAFRGRETRIVGGHRRITSSTSWLGSICIPTSMLRRNHAVIHAAFFARAQRPPPIAQQSPD
jgi:hypothetical protein